MDFSGSKLQYERMVTLRKGPCRKPLHGFGYITGKSDGTYVLTITSYSFILKKRIKTLHYRFSLLQEDSYTFYDTRPAAQG